MSISVRARPPAHPRSNGDTAAPDRHRPGTSSGLRSAAGAALAVGGVVAALLAFYLLPIFLTGARVPFGSDTTYYVWMSRLAGQAGLAGSGFRAGSHALLLEVSRLSGLDLLQSIGPLDVALEVALGLAAGALVSVALGFSRVRFVVVSVVTSAYAARMATGYLANLLFLTILLAALAAMLADQRRASLALSAGLFVAAGLSHGAFFAMSLATFGAAFALRLLWHRRDARVDLGVAAEDVLERRFDLRRLFVVAGVGAAGLALMVLTGRMSTGGSGMLHSGDAILRTLGMGSLLKAQYVSRFPGAVQAAGLAATVPLAVWGLVFTTRRFAPSRPRRLAAVLTMAAVLTTAAGLAAGGLTGLFPAGRVLGVSVWLPVLASLGVLGIGMTLVSRPGWTRGALTAVLTMVLLAAPFRSLLASNVAASPLELEAVTTVGHFAQTLPPDTPMVFLADLHGSSPAFQASRIENLARMGLDPDRMADVYVFVGGPEDFAVGRPTLTGDTVRDALARFDARRVAAIRSQPHAVFLVQPFDRADWKVFSGGRLVGPGVRVLDAPIRHGRAGIGPSLGGLSPAARLAQALLILLMLSIAGFGWTRAMLRRQPGVIQAALAPAVGAAVLALSGVGADAAGWRLDGSAVIVAPLVAALGYAVARYSGRTMRSGLTASSYSDSVR